MKEITKKLHDKHMEDFKPVIEQMAAEGATEEQIVRVYQSHLKAKTFNYYSKARDGMTPLMTIIKNALTQSKGDSKAEVIFYEILTDAGINFQFQFPIGPYRADFLIAGFLVLEIDGPNHANRKEKDDARDRYISKMGYKVLRVPLHILCACPEAVIEEIKEITANKNKE
jgi:very-short-patch-repair endonuclease